MSELHTASTTDPHDQPAAGLLNIDAGETMV
jgi:hypothetical protein